MLSFLFGEELLSVDPHPAFSCTFRIPQKLKADETSYMRLIDWESVENLGLQLQVLVLEHMIPFKAQGLGNILLPSLSVCIWGVEVYADYLRQCLFKELTDHRDFYKKVLDQDDEKYNNFLENSQKSQKLHFFHLLGIANLLRRPINIYASDPAVQAFGTGVSATFIPIRQPENPENSGTPISLFYNGVRGIYVPLVPFEGTQFVWPKLKILFYEGDEDEIFRSFNGVGDLVPKIVGIINERWDTVPEKILDFLKASRKTSDVKEHIDQLKRMRAKYDRVWQITLAHGLHRFICYNAGDDPVALTNQFCSKSGLGPEYKPKILQFVQQQVEEAKKDPKLQEKFRTRGDPNVPKIPNKDPVHVPYQGSLLRFETAQYNKLLEKLLELGSGKLDQKQASILKQIVETIQHMDRENIWNLNLSDEAIDLILKLLDWPKESLFPVLDLVRILFLDFSVIQHCREDNTLFLKVVQQAKDLKYPTNVFLVLKSIANALYRDFMNELFIENKDQILSVLDAASQSTDPKILANAAVVLINLSALFLNPVNLKDISSTKSSCAKIALQVLKNLKDEPASSDTAFKSLVAIGTFSWKDLSVQEVIMSLGLRSVIGLYINSSDPRLKEVSYDFVKMIPAIAKKQ
eukprot:TRINITY_DN10315_c0_g1_i1.p1 TRINITY_DN10315_c0_g1~~TRINITY_DN10315_c0_g1_i1.p1  ORF type:complete len:634 (-),score=129.60 TRINITY_DN10315_c0_g1_i1:55-1956(-)